VIQEAAGIRSIHRSRSRRNHAALQGHVLRLQGGAEARRFNRLLIDAGLVHGL